MAKTKNVKVEENKLKTALFSFLGVKESYEVPNNLLSILLSDRSEEFIDYIAPFYSIERDSWRDYFQSEQGDRDNFKQDFTPDCIVKIIKGLMGEPAKVLDMCSGTGSLTLPFIDENVEVQCEELTSRTIPFLLFNLAIRNVKGVVLQKDILLNRVERKFILEPGAKYSSIKEMPYTEEDNQFNTIISNPPYSIKIDKKDLSEVVKDNRFGEYTSVIPTDKADFVFVLDALNRLNDNGKAVFVLPSGVLFRAAKEGAVRKLLLEQGKLESVILLPEKLFLNTGIPVVLLVFDKAKTAKDVFMVNASELYKSMPKQNDMTDEDVTRVISVVNSREEIADFSRVVSYEELVKNDYNLSVNRYVKKIEIEDCRPIEEILADIVGLERHQQEIELKIMESCKDWAIHANESVEVFEPYRDYVEQTKPINFKNFEYVPILDLVNIERAKAEKVYKAGSTLIQVSATKGQVLFLEEDSEVAPKYAVLEPKDITDGAYLYYVIQNFLPDFLVRYQTDMNIQLDIFKFFEVGYHLQKETRDYIANSFMVIDMQRKAAMQLRDTYQALMDYILNQEFNYDVLGETVEDQSAGDVNKVVSV